MTKSPRKSFRTRSRGLSLIELMVGITIGMIVVAGASVMMVTQINEHRRLMLETQVQQDLRAAGDLILRELRRAGYRGEVAKGVWSPDPLAAAVAASSPYTVMAPNVSTAESTQVQYRYSVRAPWVFNSATEQFGFKLDGGVLRFQLGAGGWQPLTDPNTLTITDFNVATVVQTIDLADYCPNPCPAGLVDCPPVQQVRNFNVRLTGEAKHDPAVVRTLNVSTRVRNDQIVGVCPP